MPFPLTPTLDDFQRADENPLSKGGAWANSAMLPGDYRVQLTSAIAQSANASGWGSAAWGTAVGNDHEVWGIMDPNSSTGWQFRLYFRIANVAAAGLTGYSAIFQKYSQVTLYKMSGAAFTQIGQVTGLSYGVTDTIGCRISGSSISCFVAGTDVLDVTDSTYSTGGNIGLGTYGISTPAKGFTAFGGGAYSAATPAAVYFDTTQNFAYSTVQSPPSPAASGTSIVPADIAAFPDPATQGPYNVTVWPAGTRATRLNAEICRVTQKTSTALIVNRAQEGTSARTIIAGDQIAHALSDKIFDDIVAKLGPSVSRKYGTAVISDGGTITHGLGQTPDYAAVHSRVAGEFCSVTARSSTTLTVAIKKHDGTAGTGSQTVDWEAVYLNPASSA